MSETALSKAIRGALEASGVWVIPIKSAGAPELLLPEYGAWLRIGKPNEAWDAEAKKRGVRVSQVFGVLEAQLRVSIWQDETPKQNPSGWQKSRAKYVARSAHLHVVR